MKKKLCLITGANSGIGKAAAIQLAKEGFKVIIGSRNKDKGTTAVEEIRKKSGVNDVELQIIDMSSQNSIKAAADEINVKFSDIYDGETLKYTHTNALLKLYIPIVIGTSQREAIFPSITLWGSEPEPVPVNTDIENVIVAFGENEFKIQNQGECFKYNIIINCLARHDEILQMLSTVVRHTLKQGIIWVNGLKLFIKQEGGAQQFDPNIPIEIEPQIQYRATIEIHEFVSEYKTLPTVKLINNRITIEEI